MGEKKLPLFLTLDQLKEHVINWSDDIVRSRIESGFPAIQEDNGRYVFPRDEVLDYFKRRKVQNAPKT